MQLFTIGHSNHSIDTFIGLLKQHHVAIVADVRSAPYCRYVTHFNKAPLQALLTKAGIQYQFLGRELGAKPDDPTCYIDGKAIHEKIASTSLFQAGIQHLKQSSANYKIALMCAEKDPITCHRAVLICRYLRNELEEISHILSNGDLETHKQLEDRLINLHSPRQSNAWEQHQLSFLTEPIPANPADSFVLEKVEFQFPELPLFAYGNQEATRNFLEKVYQRQSEQIAYAEKVSA
jgi:uncharacterized protein (DUF488 family)